MLFSKHDIYTVHLNSERLHLLDCEKSVKENRQALTDTLYEHSYSLVLGSRLFWRLQVAFQY